MVNFHSDPDLAGTLIIIQIQRFIVVFAVTEVVVISMFFAVEEHKHFLNMGRIDTGPQTLTTLPVTP